jgi:hypothetical protein
VSSGVSSLHVFYHNKKRNGKNGKNGRKREAIGVAMDRAMMAYKVPKTDVLYSVEMAWRADATVHARVAHARLHFLTAK